MTRNLIAGWFIALLVVATHIAAGTNSWTFMSPVPRPRAIAIDPLTPSTMYVAGDTFGPNESFVLKTTDGGNTWTRVLTTLGATVSIVIDPSNTSTLYVAGFTPVGPGLAQIYKSTDGGTTWSLPNAGTAPCLLGDLAIAASSPSILYLTCGDGSGTGKIFRTTDGAQTWTLVLAHNSVIDSVTVDPTDASRVYVGGVEGVLRSIDAGQSWTLQALGTRIEVVRVDPAAPSNIYAGSNSQIKGVFKSADGGTTWGLANNGLLGGPFDPSPYVVDIAILPGSPSALFVATFCGVFRSLDAAAIWAPASTGLPQRPDTCLGDIDPLATSPAAPNVLIGLSSSLQNGLVQYTHDATLLPPGCYLAADPESVPAGGSSTLSAQCTPAATSYLWSFNAGLSSSSGQGTVLPPHTSTYTVRGVNANGTGNAAGVTVTAPTGRMSGISTRAQVLGGDEVMIGGFITHSLVHKTVLMRARGPSLAQAGVVNALPNPKLHLIRDGAIIAENDDWGSAPNAAAIQASGMAPGNAAESAILTTVTNGAYTAILSGVGQGGVGILEILEVDQPAEPLIGISTRGKVLTGDDVMIAGFVIAGDGPQTVIVRGRGPSLVAAGISDALANPMLQLVRSSDQSVIATNDDWEQASNAAAVSEIGFAPTSSLESAILITLPPGAYTAILSGVGGGAGVGIVEVFELP